jgi:hypothetical protein
VNRFRSRGHHACPRCGGHLSIAGHPFDAHHQRREGGKEEERREKMIESESLERAERER